MDGLTYETVTQVSQIAALILFIGLFVCVLGYVFWPANRSRFERAAHLPLQNDTDLGDEKDERHGQARN